MKPDEILETWLAEKRKLTPPPTFSKNLMMSVSRLVEVPSPVMKAFPCKKSTTMRYVPDWVTSATVLVCVMRTACFVQMLVEPSFEVSLVTQKTTSEIPNAQ